MIRFQIYPAEEPSPPGPTWEPVVYDGKFPLTAEAGDIYINRYRDPPLYYVFTTKSNCELVDREDIKTWVTGGLMKNPGPVQKNGPHSPSASSKNTSLPSE